MKNLLYFIICLIIFSGCDNAQSVSTLPTLEDTANKTWTPAKNMDDYLAEVADKVPGFGGYYYDFKTGAMMIWLKSEDDKPKAVEALVPYMEANLLGVVDINSFKNMNFLVRISSYDFRQFKTFMDILNRNVKVTHFTSSDIDEYRHKIVIGVYDLRERSQILTDCAKAGIPSDAVEVEFRDRLRFF